MELIYLALVEEPSSECGHVMQYFDSLEKATKAMVDMRATFEEGMYWNSAEVTLCVVLAEEAWRGKRQS